MNDAAIPENGDAIWHGWLVPDNAPECWPLAGRYREEPGGLWPEPVEEARAVQVTRVIAGASGSPGGLAALRYADGMARACHAILVPLLAWQPPGGHHANMLHPARDLRQELRDIACQRMREALLAVWDREPPDSYVRPQLEEGPPGSVLVSLARRPGDVLVVGAGRRGPLHRIAGRRVSGYCAARALCPVILVPPPEISRDADFASARLVTQSPRYDGRGS